MISKHSKSKIKRASCCEGYVGPVGNCNGNSHSNCKCNSIVTDLFRSVDICNGNCNSNGDGHGNGNCNCKCNKHASVSEAGNGLFDELKIALLLVHISRRLSRKAATSIDVGIVHKVVSNILLTESEEKDRQMKDQNANIHDQCRPC